MMEFKADIAVLLNITPDHLDRYDFRMDKYAQSKMGIIRNQTYNDYFIYSNDDCHIAEQMASRELAMRLLPFTSGNDGSFRTVHGHTHGRLQGAWMSGDDFVAVVGNRRFAMPTSQMRIRGKHNLYDAMAATMAAMAAGVPEDSMRRTLSEFEGIEHRLEWVAEIGGVEWINDSKATNVDSVWYALESMKRPVVWIAGGTDKGNDYEPLKEFARTKVKALVCMGVDNSKLIESFRGIVHEIADTRSLDDAMCVADAIAANGDTVLLSPACASFDLFKNYEDRGQQFKTWIEENN
jgi:UDP-N-acetylmuramoylalanine--D-glutamate ligase